MTCTPVDLGNGFRGIVCTRGQRKLPCAFCGTPTHALCDFPLRGKACSTRICERCGTHVGEDRDLCPPHMRILKDAGVAASVLADPNPTALLVAVDQALERGAMEHVEEGKKKRSRWKNLDDWKEFRLERAAIYEYLGELSRDEAEMRARADAGPMPK
jgi:hypothetical protein